MRFFFPSFPPSLPPPHHIHTCTASCWWVWWVVTVMVAVTHADAQARYGVRGRGGVQRRFKRHASTRGKSVSTVQLGEENGFLRAGGETGTHAGAQARCGVRGRGEVQSRFTRHARTCGKGVRAVRPRGRCPIRRRHNDVGTVVGVIISESRPVSTNIIILNILIARLRR